jgi:hypothetical protein
MACQAGVVDLDNLRDALSYFLQELLRFTLPGVLRWLIEEVGKSPFVFLSLLLLPARRLLTGDREQLLARSSSNGRNPLRLPLLRLAPSTCTRAHRSGPRHSTFRSSAELH